MTRVGLLIGTIGGIAWLALPFFPPECAPITRESEVFCNRLWTPLLAAMAIGAIGLFRMTRPSVPRTARLGPLAIAIGFAMMVGGNFAEYWLAFELPHQGGPGAMIRGLLFMTLLAGWLLALVGSLAVGLRLARFAVDARWAGLLFIPPLPLTFVFASIDPSLAGLPIGLLGIVVGGYGLLRLGRASVEPT